MSGCHLHRHRPLLLLGRKPRRILLQPLLSEVVTYMNPLYDSDILFPRTVQRNIREGNERCFNVFIEFPKPIIAAVNGPGIGAGTTAPALCDVVIASEKATFSTPFTNLGVGPEGCASVHLERILGRENASRMLDDCWRPSAQVLFSNTVIVSLAGPFLGSQADRSGI